MATATPIRPPQEDTGHQRADQSVNPSIGQVMAEAGSDHKMILNMGPQHPSTHGVLRLVLEIDGETVNSLAIDIGYLHTGIEKTCEAKFYQQVVPLTDRIDYLSPMSNNLCYCLAVEKLLGLEIPGAGAILARHAERAHTHSVASRLAGYARARYRRIDHVPLLLPRARRHSPHL